MSFYQISNGSCKQQVLCVRFILSSLLLAFSFFGFAQNAKRVVSLTPSITENIYLLGAQDKLVGCTSYCMQAVADGKELRIDIQAVTERAAKLRVRVGIMGNKERSEKVVKAIEKRL